MKQNSIETGFMNAGGAQWIPPTTTFALPPSSPATGVVFIFTDALTSGAAVGGGTSLSYCRWSGNAWIAIVGGGGGVVSSVFGRSGAVAAVNGDYSAAQVTNAVSTLGSYGDPAWVTSLAYSKLTGTPSSFPPSAHTHAASDVISGVFVVARLGTGTPTASNYLRGDGAWTVLPASAVTSVFTRTGAVVAAVGDYTAAQITNAVSVLGSYADPVWITTLAWSKITGAPATGVSSVFGRSGAVVAAVNDYTAAQVTNAVSTLGSYSDPAWITGLAWAKITGAPSVSSYQTPWLSNINAAGFNLNSVGGIGIGASALATYAIYAVLNTTTNITALFRNTNVGGASGIVVQNDGSHSGNLLCAGSAYANPAWRNNTVINTGTTDSLILATNSIERVTVTAAGDVGLGNDGSVSPGGGATDIKLILGNRSVANGPYSALCLAGNTSTTSDQVGSISFANYNLAAADKRLAAINCNTGSALDSGVLVFYTWNAGVVGERMRITSAGNVGIGTTGPSCRLSLGTQVTDQILAVYDGGAGSFYGFGIRGGTLMHQSGGDHVFYSGATVEMVRINASGGVAIQYLPSTNPGAGTKQLWYTPADGLVHYAA